MTQKIKILYADCAMPFHSQNSEDHKIMHRILHN